MPCPKTLSPLKNKSLSPLSLFSMMATLPDLLISTPRRIRFSAEEGPGRRSVSAVRARAKTRAKPRNALRNLNDTLCTLGAKTFCIMPLQQNLPELRTELTTNHVSGGERVLLQGKL